MGIGTWLILGGAYVGLSIWAASALCRALFKKEDHYIKEAKIIPFRVDPEEEFIEIHHDL
jgi:hypothetical protein